LSGFSPPLEVRGGWEGLSSHIFTFASVKNSSARFKKAKLKTRPSASFYLQVFLQHIYQFFFANIVPEADMSQNVG
jgi:hypothetical protein